MYKRQVLAPTDAAAQGKAQRLRASPGAIVGSPATVASQLAAYVERGADWLLTAPVDSRDVANIELLAEVRERLRG